MTHQHRKHHHRQHHQRRRGHALLMLLVGIIVAAIAGMWAWNGAGVDLFGMPEAKFSQVAAIVIALAALAGVIRFAIGGFGRGREQ